MLSTVSSAGGNRAKRKRHRVRTNSAAATDRKHKKEVSSTNQNPDPKYGGHLSDDSIGMFSLLKQHQDYPITHMYQVDLDVSNNLRLSDARFIINAK
jgi:hypothetical protein